MKNNIILLIACLLPVLFSCNKNWDDHYAVKQVSGEIFEGTLLDYIKSVPEYSKFYDALVKTEYDKFLGKDQVMTVWVPTNDALTNLPTDLPTLTLLVKNHINLSAVYDEKLDDVINGKIVLLKGRLKMLSKKHTLITKDVSGKYMIDDALISGTNIIAQNGIAHKIDKLLTVRQSTYEYLMSLGPDYSIIKDTLTKSNYKFFDKANSKATGFNKLGQVIYDTVWIIKNNITDSYDISNDEVLSTLVLSTNTQINDAVANATNDYIAMYGTNPPASLVSKMYSFCARSFILNSPFIAYPADTLLKTVNGQYWYTKKQVVNPTPVKLSNGFIYNLTSLKIPKFLYINTIQIKPIELWNFLTTPLANNKYSNAYHTIYSADGYLSNTPRVLDNQSLYFESPVKTGNTIIWEEMQSVNVATGGVVTPQLVPPGEYNLTMEFRRASGPPVVTVSVTAYGNTYVVNNNLKIESASSSNYYVYNVGDILIPSQTLPLAQTVSFKIQINQGVTLSSTQTPRISVSYYKLVPKTTINNY